jgi:hypothetical protein
MERHIHAQSRSAPKLPAVSANAVLPVILACDVNIAAQNMTLFGAKAADCHLFDRFRKL